uniref:Uncharacterized protein n=1 Tax=Wuchereria bancrofti TaxID=6293 RepID=A0AAF5PXM1_WUCBA
MNSLHCNVKLFLTLFLHFITSEMHITELTLQKIVRRKRAFDLAQIESDLAEQEDQRIRWESFRTVNSEALKDKMCQDKCNDNLRLGLDMVKAHMAFGSISFPSLIDENDLKLFCRLDDQHSWCLRDCGFIVQFNMNDFICKHHYKEMTYLLPCYRQAVPTLKLECGVKRCGPYTNTDNTLTGRALRCNLLLCDMRCTTNVLIRRCANEYGQQAAHFIMNYTSQQEISNFSTLLFQVSLNTSNLLATIFSK